jgi:hypothetical protein
MHPDKARQSFIANYGKPKPGDKKTTPVVHKRPSKREIDAYHKEASERFARLGVVTNILRGGNRERYDHFLDYGFPKWRGTGYYYKRYRPGLATVLMGLFVVFGGAAHYGALLLSWKRQREFAEKYIKNARKLAWGNSLVVPGLDTAPVVATNGSATPPNGEDSAMNRKQRRLQEKESKKAAKKGLPTEDMGSQTEPRPVTGPQGTKRRVVAENGKDLIVDSAGNVFIEEENEEGETHEYLIDVIIPHRSSINVRRRLTLLRSTKFPAQQSTTLSSSRFPAGPGAKPSAASTPRPSIPQYSMTQREPMTLVMRRSAMVVPRMRMARRGDERSSLGNDHDRSTPG